MSDQMTAYRIRADFYGWDDARLERAIEEQNEERQRLIAKLEDCAPAMVAGHIKAIEGARDKLAVMLFERDRRLASGYQFIGARP